jgi:hypothetical protein
MQTLAAFYPFVEPEVMGCPYPVIDHHLLMAIRDLCQRGHAWREWVDAFTADGTTNQFDYDLVSGQDLVKVVQAKRNETDDLTVYSADQLPNDWEAGDSTRLVDAIVNYDGASFMVYPLPASGDTFRLLMEFQPTITATQVGDVLLNTWADEVSAGCKARLMRMIDKPWANAALAGAYAGDFERAIHRTANADFAMRGKEARRVQPAPNGRC